MSATGQALTSTRLDVGPVEDMTALARLVVERYGYTSQCRLHLFPLTENWTYRVTEEPRDPAVLRLYRPGNRTMGEVLSELAWMRALQEQALPRVPDVVPDPDGGVALELVRGELDTCLAAVFDYAPGHEPPDEQYGEWFPKLGAITARLHLHARSWTPPSWFSRLTWDLTTTLGDRPHWGPWQSSVSDPEQRRQLSRLAAVVAKRLEAYGTGPSRFGLVHADLRLANILVDDDRLTVVDFDDSGFSWFMYDVACALTFMEDRADVDELVAVWVAGYREVAPLDPADEEEIPTFLMLRRLLVSAYLGLRAETYLADEMLEAEYNAGSCLVAEKYLSRFG